jgi:CheY-like chemotaxis protein
VSINDSKKEVKILIAEDDEGHRLLIKRNFVKAGICNNLQFFEDGQSILDFIKDTILDSCNSDNESYLLILDINMPKVSGIEVLEFVKMHEYLKKIPVIMLTTTDDPREVDSCYELGCNSYITKPVVYEDFIKKIRNLGLFITVTEIPKITRDGKDDYE